MKHLWIILGLSFSLVAQSGVPTGCPSTRACTEDRNCRTYAMKHNCQSVCSNKEIKNTVGELINCPSQCLCIHGTQKKLLG